jgi:hypothetical protein
MQSSSAYHPYRPPLSFQDKSRFEKMILRHLYYDDDNSLEPMTRSVSLIPNPYNAHYIYSVVQGSIFSVCRWDECPFLPLCCAFQGGGL